MDKTLEEIVTIPFSNGRKCHTGSKPLKTTGSQLEFTTKPTFKLDFPGNLCWAAFVILAMFQTVTGSQLKSPLVLWITVISN